MMFALPDEKFNVNWTRDCWTMSLTTADETMVLLWLRLLLLLLWNNIIVFSESINKSYRLLLMHSALVMLNIGTMKFFAEIFLRDMIIMMMVMDDDDDGGGGGGDNR